MRKNIVSTTALALAAAASLTLSACAGNAPAEAPAVSVTQNDLTPRTHMTVVRDWVSDPNGNYRIVKIEDSCFVQFLGTYKGSLTPIECPKP